MIITAPQCGHCPFLPAFAAGTVNVCLHFEQDNRMGAVFAGSAVGLLSETCALAAGVSAGGLPVVAIEATGIWTLVLQSGHCPRLPAVLSGVRMRLPQPGQWNSIGIKNSNGDKHADSNEKWAHP